MRWDAVDQVWSRAVVVVQLAEQSLQTPEIRGLNPIIGKVFRMHLFVPIC